MAAAVSVRQVQSRSRWVAAARLMLPATALTLLAVLLAWPSLFPDEKRFRLSKLPVTREEEATVRMLNPRFVGTDDQQRPYTVTATEATQLAIPGAVTQDSQILLTQPKADLTGAKGDWVQLSAHEGRYDKEHGLLTLSGAVTLFHDSGYEMHTEQSQVDLTRKRVAGILPITGQGPSGDLSAEDGFEIIDKGQKIFLLGRSRVVLRDGGGAS
ncbi:MAG: LPS export ABC transporter periplasmic protein LptC [Elstera sp.]|jgi:lipopolysaccharide export system protein LptC|uniref:LPS export ABC transporter periplasmic protein LptC n=1 Tax=Elstera sp. TaxID=1916664 RepID=UPI0037C0D405